MDDIADILANLASEEPYGWDLGRNEYVITVKAYTLETFEDRDGAFTAASALLSVITELGYKISRRAEIAVVAEESFNEWRGKIDVALVPV